MTLTTTVSDTPAGVGDAVADVLQEAITRARREHRRAVIGWPVGRSPRPVVTALIAGAERLDLSDVVLALMDDYVTRSADGTWRRVDEALPHSCRGTAQREVVQPLNAVLPRDRQLPSQSLWSPDAARPPEYDERLAGAGGVDVFVVALGASDGHVAFNPPGSPRDSRTRIVSIADSTRRDNLGTFPDLQRLDDVPTHGVSVGLATITDARTLAVVAHGESKQGIVERLVHADHFVPELPMTAVLNHPDAHLYCDTAARSRPAPTAVDA